MPTLPFAGAVGLTGFLSSAPRNSQCSKIESFLEFPRSGENLYSASNSSWKRDEKQRGEKSHSEFTRKLFNLQRYSVTPAEFNKVSHELVQNSAGGSEEVRSVWDPLDPTVGVPGIPSLFQSILAKARVSFPLHGMVSGQRILCGLE